MRSALRMGAALAGLAAAFAFPIGVEAQRTSGSIDLDLFVLTEEAQKIANKIQCPVCEGQSIVVSNATIAKQMRVVVQEQVDQGWSESRILAYFEDAYGSLVLREPPLRGIAAGVWVAPPLIALVGMVIAATVVRRWHRGTMNPTSPFVELADEALVDEHLSHLEDNRQASR